MLHLKKCSGNALRVSKLWIKIWVGVGPALCCRDWGQKERTTFAIWSLTLARSRKPCLRMTLLSSSVHAGMHTHFLAMQALQDSLRDPFWPRADQPQLRASSPHVGIYVFTSRWYLRLHLTLVSRSSPHVGMYVFTSRWYVRVDTRVHTALADLCWGKRLSCSVATASFFCKSEFGVLLSCLKVKSQSSTDEEHQHDHPLPYGGLVLMWPVGFA